VPAVVTDPIPDPILDLRRTHRLERALPALVELREVVRMHGGERALVVERLLLAHARQIEPVRVDPLQSPRGVARPDDVR
jgi:hypothetical protein